LREGVLAITVAEWTRDIALILSGVAGLLHWGWWYPVAYYGYDGWPYYYRPHYYDPGWSRGFNATEQLLQCLSAQPFVSCG
jgi:hypothetical protein